MNPELYNELVKQINRLQKQVDGLIKPEVGRWIDWTPTVTQGVAVAVTVVEAKYKVAESDVRVYARLSVTAAGTAGSNIVLTGWPASIDPSPGVAGWPMGIAVILDASPATTYSAICRLSAGTILFASQTANSFVGNNPAVTLANGDSIFVNMYWKI